MFSLESYGAKTSFHTPTSQGGKILISFDRTQVMITTSIILVPCILVTLRPEDKFNTKELVDPAVSAEIPDKENEPCIDLSVHLPNQQEILFEEDEHIQRIKELSAKPSKLIAWFELNRTSPEARIYKYPDISEPYTWQAKTSTWTERKQKKTIGPIAEVFSQQLSEKCKYGYFYGAIAIANRLTETIYGVGRLRMNNYVSEKACFPVKNMNF
ncbi:hypothetical protein TcasGA2_TC010088 [Tribolium castaneum]|uniref:Uncharacterized protein n=1 Tax=Tribolium castaneum TaxID=7070 RepID=D6WS81_TRICA|nr:hypothetical protein TcasGA2_TC010088 [Tribolium castaneum]